MISTKEFGNLDIEAKKKVLLTIFSQLPSKSAEIQDIQDLLQLDFAYQASTLDGIYKNIQGVINEGSQDHNEQLSQQAHKAHELLEKEALESADEADDILDAI